MQNVHKFTSYWNNELSIREYSYINKILTLLYIQKYIYVISDYFNYLSNEIQIEN